MICVRDWLTTEIIPLRYFSVKHVSKFGSLFHIEYQILDYIDYDNDNSTFDSQLFNFNKEITNIFKKKGWKNSKNDVMNPLIFPISEINTINSFKNNERNINEYDFGQWLITLKALKRFELLHGMPFLKFIITNDGSNKSLSPKFGRYHIDASSDYTLSIFHYLAESSDPTKLTDEARTPRSEYMKNGPYLTELTSTGSQIFISPSAKSFSGRYDQSNFFITANKSGFGSQDMLLLKFTVPEDISKSFNSIFEIPINIKKPFKRKIIRGFFSIIFISILIFISYNNEISQTLPESLRPLIKDMSLVFFSFQAIDLAKNIWGVIKEI